MMRLICRPHSFLSMSWTSAMNSRLRSIITSSGHGYLSSQVRCSKLLISSACLFGTSTISNQPVAGSIIVRQCSVISVLGRMTLPFLFFVSGLPNLYGPMRSIHRVFHGTTFGSFGGRCPSLRRRFLDTWQSWHLLHTSTTVFLMSCQ